MRHFLIFATVALSFLMWTSMASAFSTNMERVDGVESIDIGDTVMVEVFFDTEEQNDIALLSVSVLFDPNLIAYVPGASFGPTYALYVSGGKNNQYLVGASTNLTIRAGTLNQVLLDWQNTVITEGNRDACGATDLDPTVTCGFMMASLVFEALAEGEALFELSNTSPGNIIQLIDGTNPPNPVTGDFAVQIPEPTSASLSIFALLSLAGLRLRAARR